MKSPRDYNNLISLGAMVALAGYLLSGPLAFILVSFVKPQPEWTSAAVFAANYSIVQDLPYYFGFLLIGGMLMVTAGHYLNYNNDNKLIKFHLLVSLAWAIVFCTLITFNYVCQTTFVRNLALNYRPEHDMAIATFSMANPMSFCWANEMWGYAFLGISNLLMAGYYLNKNNFIRSLLITNGAVSIASALWTAIDVQWVLTISGLIAYFVWNALMIVMMLAIYRFARKQTA